MSLLFGGSFDPFHLGHLAIINALHHHFPNTPITLLPAQTTKPNHSTSYHRYRMLHALLQHELSHIPMLTISDIELQHPTPSPTLTSLKSLPQHTPYSLVIGADQANQFHTWHNPTALLETLEKLIIITRPGYPTDLPDLLQHTPKYQLLQIPDHPIASHQIRDIQHQQKPINRLVPKTIHTYIHTHNLYQDTPATPTIIGLTGRVGSGKSTATAALATLPNLTIIDLDSIGHQLLNRPDIQTKLITEFGPQIQDKDDSINRQALGHIVFNDGQLPRLNRLIHPAIKAEALAQIDAAHTQNCLIVGALIQEIELEPYCTTLIVIDADDRAIIEKIGDKFTKISPHQRSRDAYMASAHHLIKNEFTPQFELKIWQTVQEVLQ